MNIKQDKSGLGLPITRIETISEAVIDPTRVGYANLTEKEASSWFLENGDILFSHINSIQHIGKCAIYRGQPDPLVHGMNLLCFRCDQTKLYPEYAKYLLQSKQFRVQLSTCIKKAVNQASVSIGDIQSIVVVVPSFPEQQRIAMILDKADALRTKRRATLALLNTLNQSIFLDMFGDPIINPRGWPKRKLGTLGSLDRGVSKHRPRNAPELLGGPYPFVQTGDVANSGGYIRKYSSTYSEIGLQQSKLWPAGTLCITIAANIAKTGILTFDACFPDSVVGFRSEETGMVEFIRTWLSFLQASLEDKAPESAQKNINLEILRGLDVPIPDEEVRIQFFDRVMAIEKFKSLNKLYLDTEEAFIASLQFQAFRGDL